MVVGETVRLPAVDPPGDQLNEVPPLPVNVVLCPEHRLMLGEARAVGGVRIFTATWSVDEQPLASVTVTV